MDLVVSPTRSPRPISQVAENMTIITAEDIKRMNAHTVAEVLNRVTGVFVSFNQDLPSLSSISTETLHIFNHRNTLSEWGHIDCALKFETDTEIGKKSHF